MLKTPPLTSNIKARRKNISSMSKLAEAYKWRIDERIRQKQMCIKKGTGKQKGKENTQYKDGK